MSCPEQCSGLNEETIFHLIIGNQLPVLCFYWMNMKVRNPLQPLVQAAKLRHSNRTGTIFKDFDTSLFIFKKIQE